MIVFLSYKNFNLKNIIVASCKNKMNVRIIYFIKEVGNVCKDKVSLIRIYFHGVVTFFSSFFVLLYIRTIVLQVREYISKLRLYYYCCYTSPPCSFRTKQEQNKTSERDILVEDMSCNVKGLERIFALIKK